MSTGTLNRVWAVAILLAATVGLWPASSAQATTVYNNSGPFATPILKPASMPGLPAPEHVPGKEYSTDFDSTTAGIADPGRVITWDGLGGTADWLNFTDRRTLYAGDDDVDAMANFFDTLVAETRADSAHLIFSVAASTGVSPSGPIYLQDNDNQLGGAGELSYERAGAFPLPPGQSLQHVWADRTSINGGATPDDVDAVELWGPEPAFTYDERNKYSLHDDHASYDAVLPGDAVSVWNYDGTPFLAHSMIVDVVEELLGTPADPGLDYIAKIDVDALMIYSINGSPYTFDPDMGTGDDDVVLFSIRQIADPQDVEHHGYYATGSEIFWLDGSGNRGFLHHGGHDWSRDYAVSHLRLLDGSGIVDIDALEAVTAVPEPPAAGLALLGVLGLWALTLRRRLPV